MSKVKGVYTIINMEFSSFKQYHEAYPNNLIKGIPDISPELKDLFKEFIEER